MKQFDFSVALDHIKAGYKVQRTGWNGNGMFVFRVPGSTFKANRAPLLGIYPEGTEIHYNPHIDIKTVDGSICAGWRPTQLDLFAEDWQIVE